MVAAGGRLPGGAAGPLLVTAAAAALVAFAVHAGAPHLGGVTAWMQGLLACSHRHPPPEGEASDVGVVLGYALHRWAATGAAGWPDPRAHARAGLSLNTPCVVAPSTETAHAHSRSRAGWRLRWRCSSRLVDAGTTGGWVKRATHCGMWPV